jgi:hypothetical protein
MITTLKITTIFAAIVCISLVGFVGAFGLRGDPEIEQLVNSPRLVKGKDMISKAPSTEGQISPLVKEAQKFALRIDPPPPPSPPPNPVARESAPPVAQAGHPPEPPKPPVTTAKFDVIATCRYEDEPTMSMVLLDLPAKGLKWFRVGENVEHLTVVDVLDGSVIMSQSGRNPQTLAMKKQQPITRDLLLQEGQKLDVPTSRTIAYEHVYVPPTAPSPGRGNAVFVPDGPTRAPRTFTPDSPAASLGSVQPPTSARQPRTVVPPTRPRTPVVEPPAEQRKAVLDDNIADLKSIMANPNPQGSNAEVAEEQKALAKLLQLLEEERKIAEQQSKVTTSDSKPKQGE